MAEAVLAGIDQVGSVGTLIGASMETAGHLGQSLLLDAFNGPVGLKLGGLLYLIGIIGALITLSSGGSYRFGLWLLLGPPLFFFLIGVREESGGAKWKFGQRDHGMEEVEDGVRGLIEGEGAGQVSVFFAGWNKIVSGAVQGLVELVGLSDNGSDLDFMNKTDRYLQLWGANTLDPRLSGFINSTLVNRCSDYFALRRRVANPMIESSAKEKALEVLDRHGKKNIVANVHEDPWLMKWLQAVYGPELQGLPDTYRDPAYTCDKLWGLSVEVFKHLQADNIVDIMTKTSLPEGYTEQQARERLLMKFGMQTGQTDAIIEHNFAGTVPGGNAQDDIRLTILINELAARMIYKEMAKLNPNLAAQDMNEHSALVRQGGHRFDEETSRSLRMLQDSDEYQYKGELIIGALTMPYIQGCVLYFLSITFPFFALALLLPGRHTGFLLWMGLWLWVKLWDFGFAVVMLIDNMLYALMPHGPPMYDNVVADPAQAFKALLEVDPTYSVGTYYNLVAVCLLAVPVVTGFLVHRGGRELTDAVSSTYREFPTKFGTSTAAYKRAMQAQHNLKKARLWEYEQFHDKAQAVIANDKVYQTHATRAAMFEAMRLSVNNHQSMLNVFKNKELIAKYPLLGEMGMGSVMKHMKGLKSEEAIKGYLDTMIAHEEKAAKLRLNASMQMLAYEISASQYVTDMAAEAILNRFNSHDFRRPFPTAAILNYEAAKQWYPMGEFVDKTVANQVYQALHGNKTGN